VKVAELTAFHVRIPLRRTIRHASHQRTETDNLVVRCKLADGTSGFGEGVPRDYVTGETIDSDLALLARSDLASQLADWPDPLAAWNQIERLTLSPIPGDERACQGNAARCALELALLDAAGRHFGLPLRAITERLAPDLYRPSAEVRYSGAITSARGFKARLAGWALRFYGFRQIKVKVGIAGYDDPDRLQTIRRSVGHRMDLRIDANEAWNPAETVERIRELQPFGLSCVEQPVAHSAVAELTAIRRQIAVPIMLDESLCSRIDAERAIHERWCDLFNVRLSKCGGFIPSLRLVQLARQHGLNGQLGCQVGETAILSAAGRHFACSVGELRYAEGSYDRHLVREALGCRDITFGRGGRAPALTGPGLGIEIDPVALARVAVRSVRLL
jgi:muconate cycloisomerase